MYNKQGSAASRLVRQCVVYTMGRMDGSMKQMGMCKAAVEHVSSWSKKTAGLERIVSKVNKEGFVLSSLVWAVRRLYD